jgi:hypothetical protein
MGFFLQSARQDRSNIQDDEMLKAALRFYIDVFKGRPLVTSDEMTLALCARMEDFDSKSAEEWQPYFTAARKLLGIEAC